MDKILFEQLPELFESVAAVFADKRDELCDMDAKMGDGDLGLTMDKGYGARRHRQNADEGRHENVLRGSLHHGHTDVQRRDGGR